ncbi:MAG TPA: monovalent cation:proton antiporter-2 (CPA2) family protein [Rhodanobacteraceae bacterium]|nr:monovalent cation:proton antiporter-2 (CPA2) family protein [Rhodanobacteraceae bacterium]
MENHHVLQSAVVFLLATVLVVPLAKRLRLGAVLGFLIVGVVIGPSALGLIHDTARVAQISEFGVVLMLFVIGLELSPARLWVMRRAVFGTGVAQVLLCGAAILAIAHLLFGLPLRPAIIVGGALALSSTAFGLQILAERKEAGSAYGRQAFAILLFQDLAAIPLIAAVPLLGSAGMQAVAPGLDGALRVVGVILAVVVGGRYLLRPLFRVVARARIQEVSTATALLVVMGVTWLMDLSGISVTLGAFLAGVLLADSEYRHELESNIEPFKGLLLGLFFVSVGMSVDLSLLLRQPALVLGLVAALLLVKGALLWPLGRLAGRLDAVDALRLAALLASGGEFAFVLLNLALQNHLLSSEQRNLLVLAITVSMAVTPLLVIGLAQLLNLRPRKPERDFDSIETEAPRVIIAGFGRVGQIVGRILSAQRIPYVALESSIEQVDNVRRFSATSLFFGDPARPEMLRAAQAGTAEVFVLATDNPDANIRTARLVRRQYPHLKIIARARNRQHVFRLMDLGIEEPVRETFHSSLKMTRQVLELLGIDSAVAAERVERFRRHDEEVLKQQYLVYDDEAALIQTSREALADLEHLFAADTEDARRHGDADRTKAVPSPRDQDA